MEASCPGWDSSRGQERRLREADDADSTRWKRNTMAKRKEVEPTRYKTANCTVGTAGRGTRLERSRGWEPYAERDESRASAATRNLSVTGGGGEAGGGRSSRAQRRGSVRFEDSGWREYGRLGETEEQAGEFYGGQRRNTQHSIKSKTQCSDRCEEWRMGEEEGEGEVRG